MAQRRDDASGQHQLIGGCESGHQIADDEEHQESQQRLTPLEAAQGDGEDDPADGDGECVAGDQIAGGGVGDDEVGGDLGQQPHDHELGESDTESSEGQRVEGSRHDG